MQFVCMGGIFVCHSTYAFFQETVYLDKQQKLNVAFVLCFQYASAVLVSGTIILLSGQPGGLTAAFTMDDLTVSMLNFGSQNFGNRAMKMMSYPLIILAKSAKVIPVIVVGTLRGVYHPTNQQLFTAFLISIGLVIFNLTKMGEGGDHSTGLYMLCASMAFDGLVQTQTDKQH